MILQVMFEGGQWKWKNGGEIKKGEYGLKCYMLSCLQGKKFWGKKRSQHFRAVNHKTVTPVENVFACCVLALNRFIFS